MRLNKICEIALIFLIDFHSLNCLFYNTFFSVFLDLESYRETQITTLNKINATIVVIFVIAISPALSLSLSLSFSRVVVIIRVLRMFICPKTHAFFVHV